jgi:O-antigen/teichoic acid export membrane protein
MLDKIKKTGKNTAIYGVGNILNKSLGLILIPFVQKFISIEEYGWLTLIELMILALSSTIVLGITNGHERFFYKEKSQGSYGSFLFSNALILFVLSLSILSALGLFSDSISLFLFKSTDYQYAIILALVITFFEVNNIIPFHILQYEEKATQYIIVNSTRLLISLVASILLLSHYDLGIIAVLYGRLIGSGSFALFQFISTVLPRLNFKFNIEKVKITISYGFPMVFSGIGYILFSMSDRFMLSQFSTAEETGKYSFGYKIAYLVMIIVQSIGVGYLPSFYQQEKADNNARYYRKMLTYFSFSMSYLILAFLFVYQPLLKPIITNQDYWAGLNVVPVLALGFVVMGMNYFSNVGIVLKNRTIFLLLPTFAAAILNIILIYISIPYFGYFGPAISTLISQIVYVGIIAFISEKLMKIHFEWAKVLLSLSIAIVFFALGTYLFKESIVLTYMTRMLLLVLYPVLLFKLNFFEAIEIESLKKFKNALYKKIFRSKGL